MEVDKVGLTKKLISGGHLCEECGEMTVEEFDRGGHVYHYCVGSECGMRDHVVLLGEMKPTEDQYNEDGEFIGNILIGDISHG